MLINDLLNSELFSLLAENSQEVSNDEMKTAYEAFVVQVRNLNQPDNDYAVIFRSLNSTRIEVMALKAFFLCEQEKKGTKNSVLSESNSCH